MLEDARRTSEPSDMGTAGLPENVELYAIPSE